MCYPFLYITEFTYSVLWLLNYDVFFIDHTNITRKIPTLNVIIRDKFHSGALESSCIANIRL